MHWEKECRVNLKCDPEGRYTGFHSSKKHWNTVSINQDIPDEFVKVDRSFVRISFQKFNKEN
jgi:predicted DNA-binding protein (MmcQ/YjbR family)